MSIDEINVSNLSLEFNKGLELFNKIDKNIEPTNNLEVQCDIKRCIKIFEKATILCSYAAVFSENETINEVATSNLQYFLLPALLGSLHLKLTSGERKNIIEVTEIYFTDFLKRCTEYELCDYKCTKKELEVDESKEPIDELEELMVLAKRRAVKIESYKKEQQLKKKLSELRNNTSNQHTDDQIKRDYFLTMIQLYINEAKAELESLELERILIDHMEKLRKKVAAKPKKRPTQPIKPVIITQVIQQQNVCGALLKTLTIEEFHGNKIKEGIFSCSEKIDKFRKKWAPPKEPSEEEKMFNPDEEIDTDDYHILEALRQGADFKRANHLERENRRVN